MQACGRSFLFVLIQYGLYTTIISAEAAWRLLSQPHPLEGANLGWPSGEFGRSESKGRVRDPKEVPRHVGRELAPAEPRKQD